MKALPYASILALALGVGLPAAHAAGPAAPAGQSVVKTTCQEYNAMDETIKPKFIYYAVGHGKKGNTQAILDVAGIDKLKPELDEYCKVNLTKSAYQHVIKSSEASEKTNK